MTRRLLVFPCALAILTACGGLQSSGGGSAPAGGVLPQLSGSGHARPLRGRARTLPSRLLFIPLENGTIDIYPLKNPNSPVAQITGLSAFQQQMSVDASGNLFVVNNGAFANYDYVMEFAPPYDGAPTILNTYWNSQVYYPIGVAADASGNVYVSNCGDYCYETAAVYVYPPGATNPTQQITSSKFNSLAGLAIDKRGNLYAVEWNDKTFAVDVFEMRAGSGKFKPLGLHGLVTGDGGNGLSLDAAGNLYVAATSSGSNYVMEYKPGKHNAFRVIDSMPFTTEPTQLQVGPDGNLYVAIACVFTPCTYAYAFKPGAKKAFESIGSAQYTTDTAGIATAPNLQLQGSK